MSLNVSDLSTYTDENKMALIKKSVLGSRILKYATVQGEIKSSAMINILDSSLIAQAGSCGWNEAGSTILSQEELSVCPLKVNEAICLDTLEKYYTQKKMQPGSYNEDIPFEELYSDEKADKVSSLIEDIFFKGDTTSGTGNLKLCDGLIVKCATGGEYASRVIAGNTGAETSITSSNIIDIVDAMIEATPTDIIDSDDLVLYMGYDNYRTYAKALRDKNYFAYTGAENQGEKFSQFAPGTNVQVVAFRGLNGTDKMFLTRKANLFFGTDLLSDSEEFRIFYSEDNDEVRFRAKWKQGVALAVPEFTVYFSL